MRLKSVDYIYVLLSCVLGIWQAWCFNYGRNSVLIAVLMSLPFALASYARALFPRATGTVPERRDWKRTLVLWVGMPLSLVVGSLTILAETGIMYAVGFGVDNLPLDSFRLLVGEAAACLAWAVCLLVWSREPALRRPGNRLLAVFAALFVGVLFAYGLSYLIRINFHKDLFMLVTSIVVTMISALILVFLSKAHDAKSAQVALRV